MHLKLRAALPESGIALIVGSTGAGKSALAYSILEDLWDTRHAFVYGLPLEKAHLLPDQIRLLTTLDFPEGAAVLCDEAYLSFYARQSMSQQNRFMDTLSGLARQKDLLLLYITQSSRKLDIGLVEGAGVLLIKRPSLLQIKLDRGALRGLLSEAKVAFKRLRPPPGVSLADYQRQSTYIVSEDFEGMVEQSNGVPSFWSPELSKAWAGVPLKGGPEASGSGAVEQVAEPLYPSERRAMVQDLYRQCYRVSWELTDLSDDLARAAQQCAELLPSEGDPVGAWPSFMAALRALDEMAGEYGYMTRPLLLRGEGVGRAIGA